MFTIDGHLDLATNAIYLNRDLTKSVHAIREKEKTAGWNDTQDRGNGTVALPQMREGQVGLAIVTIISRFSEYGHPLQTLSLPGWHSQEQAYAYAQAQLTWYRLMEDRGELKKIVSAADLDDHVKRWQNAAIPDASKPVGYILSLEGADSIISKKYLEEYYEAGLRAIGPAHFGEGIYAAGTHSDGSGLTSRGKTLLKDMDELGIALDATHLTDKAFYEAVDLFNGIIWASHQNCRALVTGERQFTDEQIKIIAARDGIIGGALDAWMLYSDFKMGTDSPLALKINLEKLVDHFDHICQLTGNCSHIGFGTDLDGLFGTEQTPYDMDTIADIRQFTRILAARGYRPDDIENIFYKNWIRVLKKVLD
jgi:membrane dipeptidase